MQGFCKGKVIYFVNVYSSCDIVKKRQMWAELTNLKANLPIGEWCIGGDFNAIKRRSERKGLRAQYSSTKMSEFAEFIGEMELLDLPGFGNKYTWFNSAGDSMSRLDRFLVSEGLVDAWGLKGQSIEARSISDHCPISLQANLLNWGPKPFKFFSAWTTHPNFYSLVEDVWSVPIAHGRSMFRFKEKLKILKSRLKVWNREVFGFHDLQVDLAFNELCQSDLLCATENATYIASSAVQTNRHNAEAQVWSNLQICESLIKQKSRCRWLKEGDKNSKFFHSYMKARFRRNNIVGLQAGDAVVSDVASVKQVAVEHFKERFQEPLPNRPVPDGIPFNTLSAEDNCGLEAPFSL
ncbi:uncharacterized protein LOC131650972 [Vicia villosa]|uniref:uncharacterized protein LOC131650972 n=1 Tax=Vicia villosa TaxID=3911 RepID=UPI00273B6870|nr:uncharacterized protein LOC131650972 [Vicia villosa]